MQIYASGNGPSGKLSESIALETTQKASASQDAKSTETASVTQSTFAPTSDLAQLLASVRALPDVRAAVLREVGERVATGELLTPQAAQETALAAYDDIGR